MAWHTQNVQCMVTLITTTRCHLGHLRPQESSWILAQVPTRALWCSKIFPVTSAKSRTHFPRFPWTPEFFHSHRLCQFFVFWFFLEIPWHKTLVCSQARLCSHSALRVKNNSEDFGFSAGVFRYWNFLPLGVRSSYQGFFSPFFFPSSLRMFL